MQRTIMLVAAIVGVALASGIPVMPAQAVTADCVHDYDITTNEPSSPRPLGTTGNEVGRVIVDDTADVRVKVELSTLGATLDFGVFEDAAACSDAWAAGHSTCDTDEQLTTVLIEESMECVLDKADPDEEIEYFFVFENGGTSSLGYKAWIV